MKKIWNLSFEIRYKTIAYTLVIKLKNFVIQSRLNCNNQTSENWPHTNNKKIMHMSITSDLFIKIVGFSNFTVYPVLKEIIHKSQSHTFPKKKFPKYPTNNEFLNKNSLNRVFFMVDLSKKTQQALPLYKKKRFGSIGLIIYLSWLDNTWIELLIFSIDREWGKALKHSVYRDH